MESLYGWIPGQGQTDPPDDAEESRTNRSRARTAYELRMSRQRELRALLADTALASGVGTDATRAPGVRTIRGRSVLSGSAEGAARARTTDGRSQSPMSSGADGIAARAVSPAAIGVQPAVRSDGSTDDGVAARAVIGRPVGPAVGTASSSTGNVGGSAGGVAARAASADPPRRTEAMSPAESSEGSASGIQSGRLGASDFPIRRLWASNKQ